jgi:hypothetical protein
MVDKVSLIKDLHVGIKIVISDPLHSRIGKVLKEIAGFSPGIVKRIRSPDIGIKYMD